MPNRGGTYTQNCYGLLYEQRVTISDGPDKDTGIHAENGSWLNFVNEAQLIGPYGDRDPNKSGMETLPVPPALAVLPDQDPSRLLAKQVSVPHGNSLLAIGRYTEIEGKPTIPDISALPIGANQAVLDRYATEEDRNPNSVLRKTLDDTPEVEKTVIITVSTYNGGHIGNIPFEAGHANVALFETTFWIEYLENKKGHKEQPLQLQYSQTININFPTVGGGITFPHVTVNTLHKTSS